METKTTKVTAVNTENEVVETPKKKRRGISNNTRTVNQLKFHEKDATPQMLFIAHLEEVKLTWITYKQEANTQFAGYAVPRLVFHFASNHTNVDERRHVYKEIQPIESNVETIPGGKQEWRVNDVFAWIKYFMSIYYLKNRELTEAEEDALTLSFEDYDDNGEYVALDIQEVIDGYKFLFENVVAMFNGTFNAKDGETAKPCFLNEKGQFIPVYIKLLRAVKNGNNKWANVNQGELGFTNRIGEGVIEVIKGNNPPAIIRVNVIKESITPKETESKVPNLPGAQIPGATMMNAMPIGGGFTVASQGFNESVSFSDPYSEAGTDMPF